MFPTRIKSLLFYILIAFSSPVLCNGDRGDIIDAHDLRFREVLYYLYQQQYQTALTHLESIKQESAASHPDQQEEIAAGELNLGYGLLDKAEDIFQRLLEKQDSTAIPDEIWLELAKIYYTRNSIDQSTQALSHIRGPLSGSQLADYELLNANLLNDQDRNPVKNKKLDPNTRDIWRYYLQYNLGVGLIRNHHADEGIRILDELGANSVSQVNPGDEIQSLKDKANTTLGFYYLDTHDADKAVSYFEKVRLDSAHANKALLGIGWAYAELGDLKHALTPWMKLQKGAITDVAVQESLLTVPYALNELKAPQQALDQYNNAIDSYKKEIQTIQSQIDAIKKNGWLSSTDNMSSDRRIITYQDIRDRALQNPYLDTLTTDGPFLRTVNHYNDLTTLKQTLEGAQHDISVYRSYLVNRRHLILDRTPDTLHDNYVRSTDAGKELDKLKQELAHIAATEDALALMTKEEQSQLIVLKLVNDNIADLSRLFNLGRLDDKLRIYRGVILWDITMQYDERLKKAQQTLADMERNIGGLSRQRAGIKDFSKGRVGEFDDYEDRFALLENRISAALREINSDITIQKSRLADRVIDVLQKQQSHLTANLGQAYTSITQLYELAYLERQKGDRQ